MQPIDTDTPSMANHLNLVLSSVAQQRAARLHALTSSVLKSVFNSRNLKSPKRNIMIPNIALDTNATKSPHRNVRLIFMPSILSVSRSATSHYQRGLESRMSGHKAGQRVP